MKLENNYSATAQEQDEEKATGNWNTRDWRRKLDELKRCRANRRRKYWATNTRRTSNRGSYNSRH